MYMVYTFLEVAMHNALRKFSKFYIAKEILSLLVPAAHLLNVLT